jgi:glycosyltransferase involved in cell wall biosynthesis
MKISIITPSYNQGSFIEDTILSIKNQDYPNIEHIIVDAGSTDNTIDILKKYEGTYNMKWISEPDKGLSDAINKGVKMSSGDILGWLNSDDIYMFTDSISKIMESFQKNQSAEVVFGDLGFIDKKGEIMTVYAHRKFDYQKLLSGRYSLVPQNVFFRNYVLIDNEFRIDLHLAMDFEFWRRIGGRYKFKHISDVVAAIRVYPETKSGSKKNIDKWIEEKANILANFGGQKKLNILTRIFDKITRGGNARLIGLFYLIQNKYLYKRTLAFRGNYRNFPYDVIQQLFLDPLSKYIS